MRFASASYKHDVSILLAALVMSRMTTTYGAVLSARSKLLLTNKEDRSLLTPEFRDIDPDRTDTPLMVSNADVNSGEPSAVTNRQAEEMLLRCHLSLETREACYERLHRAAGPDAEDTIMLNNAGPLLTALSDGEQNTVGLDPYHADWSDGRVMQEHNVPAEGYDQAIADWLMEQPQAAKADREVAEEASETVEGDMEEKELPVQLTSERMDQSEQSVDKAVPSGSDGVECATVTAPLGRQASASVSIVPNPGARIEADAKEGETLPSRSSLNKRATMCFTNELLCLDPSTSTYHCESSADNFKCGEQCYAKKSGMTCASGMATTQNTRMTCPVGKTACPVGSDRDGKQVLECIDSNNDLESCGGCTGGNGGLTPTGQDCSSIVSQIW